MEAILTGTLDRSLTPKPYAWASSSTLFETMLSSADEGDSAAQMLANEKKLVVVHRLHQILVPFMLRRQVQDVEGKLPPKVEGGRGGRRAGTEQAVGSSQGRTPTHCTQDP
eukprot:128379-Chlamydomonas_euryale.AAC.1